MPSLELGQGLAGEAAFPRGDGLHQLRPPGLRRRVARLVLGQDRQHHIRPQRPADPGEAAGLEARRPVAHVAMRALDRRQAPENARDPLVGLRFGQGVIDHGPVRLRSGFGVAAPLSRRHEGPRLELG